jgi:hypothetical protein
MATTLSQEMVGACTRQKNPTSSAGNECHIDDRAGRECKQAPHSRLIVLRDTVDVLISLSHARYPVKKKSQTNSFS